jgi:hypothetical protein
VRCRALLEVTHVADGRLAGRWAMLESEASVKRETSPTAANMNMDMCVGRVRCCERMNGCVWNDCWLETEDCVTAAAASSD